MFDETITYTGKGSEKNNAIKNFPNSTQQMTNSVGKLGSVFSKQGSNLSQASDAWDSKTKDDNKPQAGIQP